MKKTNRINTGRIIRVYWEHIRHYKGRMVLIQCFIVAASVSDVLVPLFYKRFFDLLSGDLSPGEADLTTLLVGTLVIIAFFHAFMWVCWRCSALISNWFQPRIMADLEQTSLANMHEHSYRFFSNNFAGSLVRKVSRLSRSFEDIADQVQFHFIPLSILLTGNLIVLWTRSHVLALVLLGWTVVFMIFNIFYARWKLKFDFQRAEIDSEATGVLADSITNAITTKLFTGKVFESRLYKEVTERLRRANTFTWNLAEILEAIQSGLIFTIEFVILYLAINLWKQGILTIGDFALIQGYLIGIFMKIWDFGRAVRKVFSALADADEMVQILNLPREVQDVRKAKELEIQTGRIEFQNVWFSFNKTRRILKDMNLVIEPGEKVALVGPSGAGKSTVTKLLFRFYDVERGKILIGNQNIAKVTQESLRANIALVPQEPILFHRTVMENIRYGRREATDEEVMEAAKKAHAHEFIEGLQNGYNTYVGERGVKLSGGERQRIAIARAILKNASILVLDEATSSLDSESEALIQDALAELMREKTTIVIAHRLSTIMKMDRILVIDDGQVVDSGTHAQLLRKKDNIYKKLWEIQAGGFIQ
ncbi:MAG: ABC transporter ATP-binding protein/permease [Candidatus Uhrbacteria bacterium]|nr:ABC transporter ATP-binding protein/permease [Candidatus Uhrbacteria bacterium]